VPPGNPAIDEGDTIYLTTADSERNMVSFIQSNYRGFGSGMCPPGLGFSLQNRGEMFDLTPGRPNSYAPGKRPFHTIIPAFVTKGGRPVMSFGVMGGDMQAQGHVQVMARIFDEGADVQAAAGAPRWFVHAGGDVSAERGLADAVVDGLRARGHPVRITGETALFGGAQLIRRDGDAWTGGSEPRKDGMAGGL
jgi:gamma-glutamyltranspeptidase/glutathione hydrolase